MKPTMLITLLAIVICCSCSEDISKIAGPWHLEKVSLRNIAPAGDGKTTVCLFSGNKRARYLWLTLAFEEEPDRLELANFKLLNAEGRGIPQQGLHSSISGGDPLHVSLIFYAETGWDFKSKLCLSGMSHQMPFRTPRKISK